MRVLRQRRAFRDWPRLRRVAGGYVVRGRCTTVGAWAACQVFCLAAITTVGLATLAASAASVWAPALPDLPIAGTIADRIVWARHRSHAWLWAASPSLGRHLAPAGGSPIDWPLAGLGGILFVGARPLARLLAALLPWLLRPVLMRRFRIAITASHVRIGGPLLGVRLPRDDDGPEPVRFRVASPEEYHSRFRAAEIRGRPLLRPLMELPPGIVEASHGYRRYAVLFPRRIDRAEAIVARCNEAMLRTRRTMPFSTPR